MSSFPIARMVEEFDKVEGMSAIERAIDCFKLPDGRMVQLTAKLETDRGAWLTVEPDVRRAIKDRDAREGAV